MSDHGAEIMVKAFWNGAVLADSDQTIVVEGNHYFPADSINQAYFKPSNRHTQCGWKGTASYYHLDVAGNMNKNAAWYYPTPLPAASRIAGYVAFWHGVKISED
jgi:uncharacterized protein (DUF427 family)